MQIHFSLKPNRSNNAHFLEFSPRTHSTPTNLTDLVKNGIENLEYGAETAAHLFEASIQLALQTVNSFPSGEELLVSQTGEITN